MDVVNDFMKEIGAKLTGKYTFSATELSEYIKILTTISEEMTTYLHNAETKVNNVASIVLSEDSNLSSQLSNTSYIITKIENNLTAAFQQLSDALATYSGETIELEKATATDVSNISEQLDNINNMLDN